MSTTFEEARSTIPMESLQEALDAEAFPSQASFTGLSQYCTPDWFSQQCQARLATPVPSSILDPQVGEGALVKLSPYAYTSRFGIDIDERLDKQSVHVNLILANIVKVDAIMQEVCPEARFVCVNANPPFGKRWKQGDKVVDSTAFTFDFVTRWGNCGYFIANAKTIGELGIDKHAWVTKYETHPANIIWKGVSPDLTIGVVFWQRPDSNYTYTPTSQLAALWGTVKNIIQEEKASRPPWNIYLDPVTGYLKTYLSVRSGIKIDKMTPKT